MRPPGFPEITPHREFDTDESRLEMWSKMAAADLEFGNTLLDNPGVFRMKNTDDHLERTWVQSTEIDPLERLAATHGPFIELAGPSHGKFALVDTNRLPRQLITTNIDILTEHFSHGQPFIGYPDVRADGREMPIGDQQAGAVFARYFGGIVEVVHEISPAELEAGFHQISADRGRALNEAWRMTEPGGLLIWEGGFRQDISYAKKLGWQPLMLHCDQPDQLSPEHEIISRGPNPLRVGEWWSAVMEKPKDSPARKSQETL